MDSSDSSLDLVILTLDSSRISSGFVKTRGENLILSTQVMFFVRDQPQGG